MGTVRLGSERVDEAAAEGISVARCGRSRLGSGAANSRRARLDIGGK